MKRGSLGGREGMGASLSLGGHARTPRPQREQQRQPGRSWMAPGQGRSQGHHVTRPYPSPPTILLGHLSRSVWPCSHLGQRSL